MSADIIIVNYNSKECLTRCLESIEKYTVYPYQLIIIDNNSNDGSQSYLKNITTAKVIFNNRNRGCAAGWNQGIETGKNEHIVLLNPDTLVTPGWLTQLIRTAETDNMIGVVGTKHLNENNEIIHAGVIKKNGKLINRKSGINSPTTFNHAIDVDRIYGACFMIKRSLIPVLGLFDERYFLYGEETDYCLKARKKGYRIMYSPVAIYHFCEGSKIPRLKRRQLQHQSIKLFRDKWGN